MLIVHSALRAGTPWEPGDGTGMREFRQDRAARKQVAYLCERGHGYRITLAADAVPEAAIDCRCGGRARLPGAPADAKPSYPAYSSMGKYEHSDDRTPLDRVRERRSEAELERLLAERMAAARASGVAR